MFDSLSFKLQESIQKLRGQKSITSENIQDALDEIRRQLLEADVSLKAVKLFIARVQEKSLGQEVVTGVNAGQQFTKIVYDSLVEILGGAIENRQIKFEKSPTEFLLLGLQGAGKTTTAAKLAFKYKNQKPLLVPCDLQRPAAVKQLQILAKQAAVDFVDIVDPNTDKYLVSSPLELIKLAREQAQKNSNNLIIYDTAGRLQIDTDLMAELLLMDKQINPDEKLLVIDSLIGQEAANIAETFKTQIGITGILLTKLDSDSRGGSALSVVEATQVPIKLASIGEKLEDLEEFYPDRMASRILGMGDVISLVEKAEAKIDEIESKKLEAELMKGNFNYETFMTFQNMISKLGNFSSIFKMMGMGQMLSGFGLNFADQEALLTESQGKFAKYKIAINSMTLEEKRRPELLSTESSAKSRRQRIIKGSGLKESDVSQLTTEFQKMSKMFKQFGPMLGMLQNQDPKAPAGIDPAFDPMDMLGSMMGGLNKQQRKAIKQSGMLPSMAAAKASAPQIKKGTKPAVKGFAD
ncbi:MAG: signal recognition particle protein [Candidatus Caenarcaniphilales bacterium]|jgi:signal recognition particle subunit SRP54|nr:signal recognition particle protein [Candidatus Caenarcaniphilales bacterium]